MTRRLTCPNGHVLTVRPKMEGKTIRCSKCKALVSVPSGAGRDADDGDDNREAKARNQRRRRQLAAVRIGLSFYRWKVILYLVALLAYLVAILLVPVIYGLVATASEQRSRTLLEFAEVVIRVLGFCAGFGLLTSFVLAPLLGIVGGSFLVRVPSESGARGLAIATLLLDVVPLGCGVLGVNLQAFTANPLDPEIGIAPIVLSLVAGLAILADFVLFMFCLSQCAVYTMDSGTAREAIVFMTYYVLAAICGPILIGITAKVLATTSLAVGVILFAMLLGWMIIMIRQLLPNLAVIDTVRGRL